MENKPKKLVTDDCVSFVMTEWCNYLCKHCMRGTRRRNTISEEVIDAFLAQVLIKGNVTLTGGEPLLALEQINYLLGRLKELGNTPTRITLITNGSIKSKQFEKFIESCRRTDNQPEVYVSNDYFHYLERKRLNDDVDFIHDRMVEYWDIMKWNGFGEITAYVPLMMEQFDPRMKYGEDVLAIGRGAKIEGSSPNFKTSYELTSFVCDYGPDEKLSGDIQLHTDGRITPIRDLSWEELEQHYGQEYNCIEHSIPRILRMERKSNDEYIPF